MTDRYKSKGGDVGDIDYIIETCQAAFEVEFPKKDGTTIAVLTAGYDEVEPDPEQVR